MRQFQMRDDIRGSTQDVSVLVRISDVYSENEHSVEIFVDPWRLLASDELTLVKGWLLKGELQGSNLGTTRKRQKRYMPSTAWASPANPPTASRQPWIPGKQQGVLHPQALGPKRDSRAASSPE
jgi:hypothetical protein